MSYLKIIIIGSILCGVGILSWCGFQTYQKDQFVARYERMKNEMYVDFDVSMRAHEYADKYAEPINEPLFQCLKYMYAKYNFKNVKVCNTRKIPNIIHCIWLGSKLPEKYVDFYQSWKDFHPGWRFVFWTDSIENYDQGARVRTFDELHKKLADGKEQFFVVDTRDINFENKVFFDASPNYGERSDILKWEVVYRFGGMYIDTDFQCLQSLDFLHYMYDFYTGVQPLDTACLQLGAALFAAVPGHPVMKRCVETIKEDTNTYKEIVLRTGPLHFTKAFYFGVLEGNTVAVALPSSYFYPCSFRQAHQPESVWRQPESLAIHHWAGSWIQPEGFVESHREFVSRKAHT